MKKRSRKAESEDEMRPEYDLRELKFVGRGVHARRLRAGTNLVLLDTDLRKAFPDDKLVNETLRVIAKVAQQRVKVRKPPRRGAKQASKSRRAA